MGYQRTVQCVLASALLAFSAYSVAAPGNPSQIPVANHAADVRTSSYSPGESTPAGRRILEWTLIGAPIGAFLLSPLIDHRFSKDDHGIWKRSNQLDLAYAAEITELAGGLWFGGDNRLGHTFWQAIDASIATGVTVQVYKYAFGRARPHQSADPHSWFQGRCCQSFPSGEVSLQASFVTPIIAEYHRDHPSIWLLEALPAYDALARMKVQGHWQTDVLAAWAIGTAWGLYAHYEPKPLVLSIMPHGIAVGLRLHFK